MGLSNTIEYARIMRFGEHRFHVQATNGEFIIRGGQFDRTHRTTANLAEASQFGTVLSARMLLGIPASVPTVDADGRAITAF